MTEPRVKGYQLIEQIGRGACSEVYKARQMKSGRTLAVKVVHHTWPDSDRLFKQIVNEFKVARRWTHPNLVRVSDLIVRRFLFWKRQVTLVMEYVPGETLSLRKDLTAEQLVRYYVDIADGIQYMHQHGYVHLDMKPQNLIVTPEDRVKIMDFGLCMPKGRYTARVRGTPAFMAPEQLLKGWVDARTDIYNVGATMFNVITGKSVQMTLMSRWRGGGDPSITSETFQSLNVDVPEELESLILQSCQRSPSERPATMERVLERLEAIRGRMNPPQTQD